MYRKWNHLGFSCVKVKEVFTWVKQLMALPLRPTNLISSVFYLFSPSVLEINVLDAKATFYLYFEKQWIQAMDPKMLSVHGKFHRNNCEHEGSHGFLANELTGIVLISSFFFLSWKVLGRLINWKQTSWGRAF